MPNLAPKGLARPNIIDLFSGCGGFGLGAELAGFKCAAAVDIDATLQSAYTLNLPQARTFNLDVAKLDKDFWKKSIGSSRIDGVIGGPPCQGFSRIGKKQTTDPRNSLIAHFYRQVKLLRPKFFVMENVLGLLDQRSRYHLDTALEGLPKEYQVLGPIVVNAVDYGAPTVRKRVMVIGWDTNEIDALIEEDVRSSAPSITVKSAIKDLPKPIPQGQFDPTLGWGSYPKNKGALSYYAKKMRAQPPEGLGHVPFLSLSKTAQVSGLFDTKHSTAVTARFRNLAPGSVDAISRYPRLSWEGYCPTLRAGTGTDRGSFQAMRPIHPDEPRVITVREGARLQGFPDWFTFHPSKWHSFRMIGNSVSPLVAEYILKKLHARINPR